LKNETTLASIAADPDTNPHHLLFAIIVDISEPTKYGEDSNYVTIIKVIDPSFHHKAQITGTKLKFFKFCSINVYTETPESAPKVQWVGDIIRLRRFKFKITEDKGELHGVEKIKYSNWLIYSGLKGANFGAINYKGVFAKNHNRETTEYEKGRITDLRDWAFEFFSKWTLKYIIWWNDIGQREKKIQDKKPNQIYEEVDLILKVTEVNQSEKKMRFVDADDHAYVLNLESKPTGNKNQILKLRCVNVTSQNVRKEELRVIKLTAHSSCLFIRPHFRDAVVFELDKKKYGGDKYYLTEYNLEKKKNQVTATKKVYEKVKLTSVAALQKFLNNEPELHQNEKFVAEGFIKEFHTTEPQHVIRKQVEKYGPTFGLKENIKGKYQVIYHIVPFLSDDSSKEPVEVHIITSEENYYIFDAWGLLPQTKDNAGWNDIKQNKLNQFSDKLQSLTAKNTKVRLVLQLLMTKNKHAFYKVIDTLFVDF